MDRKGRSHALAVPDGRIILQPVCIEGSVGLTIAAGAGKGS